MTADVHVDMRWAEIPSVYGMTVREASERLSEAGFTPVASPRRFSADTADVVGGTLPPEGAALRRTARVDLLPAREEEAVQQQAEDDLDADQLLDLGIMPNLAGWTAEQAIALVAAHGFHPWPRDTYSLDVDQGLVVFTDPRAGTAANTDPIVIWVAIPPPPPDPPSGPPDPETPIEV